jgi:hypothetical protein
MLSPTRTRSSGIWERMRSEKGDAQEGDELSWFGPIQPASPISEQLYQLKNRLVDFIVADSVGYMVGCKCITRCDSMSNSTLLYRRWIAQGLVCGGSGAFTHQSQKHSCLAP